jgi:type II secretory pathway component PulF
MALDGFSGWTEKIDDAVIRMQFGAGSRIEFYEALSLLLDNQVLVLPALLEMYKIASEDGRKPKTAKAIVIYDCMMSIKEGKSLSVALEKWTNYQETSLIAAGERSGNLKKAFDDAIKVITAKGQIRSAVLMATAYPIVLIGMACVLLNIVATQLVPKLAKVTNPENWEGAAAVLYQMSQFVTNYGKLTLLCATALIVLVFSTFGRFRGPLRVYLDRFPPWSVYRMLHGATFLLNVSVMIESGIQLREALRMLADNANPWLKERIEGAFYGAGIGGNLGVALHRAGFNFPDKKAIQYLMILANLEGFEIAMAKYGARWMEQSIKRIQVMSKVALSCGLVLIGSLLMLILFGANGIQDAIQAGIHQ